MPLLLFLILGSLQLFLMMQARLMAEHAVFRAVRAGSLSQGSCTRMVQSALLTLLPTFAKTNSPAAVADAFGAHQNNRYDPTRDSGHTGDIVWLIRQAPLRAQIPGDELSNFDDPDLPVTRLETRLVFWYPLRIPFANWVIARISLASVGLQDFTGLNPLLPGRTTDWTSSGGAGLDAAAREGLPGSIASTFLSRTNSPAGTYVFPIEATAGMRMMTPPRRASFTPQNCR